MILPRIDLAPGYSISRVLKGGWQLAGGHGPVDRQAAIDDMTTFVEAGVTTFDCADIYTGVEELIGEFLRQRRARRGAAALAPVQVHTKCVPDLDALPTLAPADLERIVDRSLSRIGVERIDLVQFHWWDYQVPGWVEAARTLDALRQAGKIRHLGLTNFDSTRLYDIVSAGVPVVSHQVQYSVLDLRPAGVMTALCESKGIGLLAYGALAGGFLSERWLGQAEPAEIVNRSLVKYRLIIEEFGGWAHFQQLLAVLDDIARRRSTTIGAVAIAWVLAQPAVAAVIVGARHARHLGETTAATRLVLDADDRARIAAVHAAAPGPAGEVYGLEREAGGRHAAIMRYNLNKA
jgi:aryl-alcohol dehydrogenase-like predicted oxidoreductase